MHKNYKVNELFQTIQGEGFYTGVPAIFVRLQGCDVGCAWCDTKHTWEIDPAKQTELNLLTDRSNESERWSGVSAQQIIDEIKRLGYTANLVVITGGEPCMYDLRELTHLLHEFGFHTQIETSGTYPVLVDSYSWVTVSPKINMRAKKEVLLSALERANEIKHPVGTEKDIDQLDALLRPVKSLKTKTICLQPISQKAKATALCMQVCIERNWRLSVQVHKYLDID
ncbi:7-carboxy-7-deazaguanine synthase QueE [Psychromonas sp. psych-6C06]|uniref:7-carboxy-7-deazaguanine synthase QueE n=1 Tax=Psychromonas sp. psych-6C06 TaxID=2058089 RepID=UPI000C324486|nr:7-carboxy-7-deazaguanine synthase QueE [Psychromonas sp. psych-6C06]PKF63415.1 7-carboxy-7-deazaguanine synthase QueE [Psychromonas sp. psych-6C06]